MDINDENFKGWSTSIAEFIQDYDNGLRARKSRESVNPGDIFRNNLKIIFEAKLVPEDFNLWLQTQKRADCRLLQISGY